MYHMAMWMATETADTPNTETHTHTQQQYTQIHTHTTHTHKALDAHTPMQHALECDRMEQMRVFCDVVCVCVCVCVCALCCVCRDFVYLFCTLAALVGAHKVLLFGGWIWDLSNVTHTTYTRHG